MKVYENISVCFVARFLTIQDHQLQKSRQ